MYEEFVQSFGDANESESKSAPRAFVRGGTIQPGSSAAAALAAGASLPRRSPAGTALLLLTPYQHSSSCTSSVLVSSRVAMRRRLCHVALHMSLCCRYAQETAQKDCVYNCMKMNSLWQCCRHQFSCRMRATCLNLLTFRLPWSPCGWPCDSALMRCARRGRCGRHAGGEAGPLCAVVPAACAGACSAAAERLPRRAARRGRPRGTLPGPSLGACHRLPHACCSACSHKLALGCPARMHHRLCTATAFCTAAAGATANRCWCPDAVSARCRGRPWRRRPGRAGGGRFATSTSSWKT